MTKTRKATFSKQVPTLEGRKQYEFVSLKRREAMEVAHTSLVSVVTALGGVAGLLFRDTKDEDSDTRGQVLSGVAEGLSSLKFETVWKLAESILRGVTIDEDTLIEDINETDYFADNLDEFYSALVAGVEGNYPKVFLKLRGAMGDFDLPNKLKNLRESKGTSDE